MSSFSDNTYFEDRISTGQNLAEDMAEDFYKDKNISLYRLGWDCYDKESKIPTNDFFKFPEQIRGLPDYVLVSKDTYFLEVKGCADNVKFKKSDMDNYKFWDKICPIVFFVYSASLNHNYRVEFKKVLELIDEGLATEGKYKDNGKEYYKIPVKELTLKGDFTYQARK